MKQSEILELLDAQEIDPKGTRNFLDIPYCWERVRELVLNSSWLDAVKEPPKEDIDYWAITRNGWRGALRYWRGEWFTMNGNYFMYKVDDVIWYMPLPLPPERSGE
jgi:hypothetical protein